MADFEYHSRDKNVLIAMLMSFGEVISSTINTHHHDLTVFSVAVKFEGFFLFVQIHCSFENWSS